MGGKAAMQLALTQGALIRRLVVADIAPVAYDHDQTPPCAGDEAGWIWPGLPRAATPTGVLADTVPMTALRAFFLQSLDLRDRDAPRWKLNLDVLEAEMDKITGWPGTSGQFDHPTLFLTGAQSHYVRPEHRETILRAVPQSALCQTARCRPLAACRKPARIRRDRARLS